jgi:hypothetical protein
MIEKALVKRRKLKIIVLAEEVITFAGAVTALVMIGAFIVLDKAEKRLKDHHG